MAGLRRKLVLLVGLTLAVSACGGGSSSRPVNAFAGNGCLNNCAGGGGNSGQGTLLPQITPSPPEVIQGTATVVPFRSDGRYRSALQPCTYGREATEVCTLARLPFLGQEFAQPTIDQVMSRVLVSHDWMGQNLAALLRLLPQDLLAMFRSVTAIVIAEDIRPAFYAPRYGAIYLDPGFLWLTPAQQADISDEPDFRSDFGAELDAQVPWRYVANERRLAVVQDAQGNRDAASLAPILALLLYHELAHAMDFMAASKLDGLSVDSSATVEEAILSGPIQSDSWFASYPLDSQRLADFAEVVFAGTEASPQILRLQPDDLVDEFANTGAVQLYGHFNQFEDLATTFESVMMHFHFGAEKDVAVTNVPSNGDTGQALVFWGQRGRLGDQSVYQRARDSVGRLYPLPADAVFGFLDGLPAPEALVVGRSWDQNLPLRAPGAPATDASQDPGAEDLLGQRTFY